MHPLLCVPMRLTSPTVATGLSVAFLSYPSRSAIPPLALQIANDHDGMKKAMEKAAIARKWQVRHIRPATVQLQAVATQYDMPQPCGRRD
jgi:hypothetical protein